MVKESRHIAATSATAVNLNVLFDKDLTYTSLSPKTQTRSRRTKVSDCNIFVTLRALSNEWNWWKALRLSARKGQCWYMRWGQMFIATSIWNSVMTEFNRTSGVVCQETMGAPWQCESGKSLSNHFAPARFEMSGRLRKHLRCSAPSENGTDYLLNCSRRDANLSARWSSELSA